MPGNMELQVETPTKIILETDSSSPKWSEYLRTLVIPPLLLAGVLIFMNYPIWLNWVITILAILIEIVMILVVFSELTKTTVTIDLNSQRATRSEKLFFRRPEKIELDLNQVKRILIHCEEQGHHCRMLLESTTSSSLELDFYFPTNEKQEASIILSKKIGSLLGKPVGMKVTDLGNLISEEIIQA